LVCRFEYVPATPEPVSDEVKALMEEQGVDFETSGLKYLTNEARVGPCSLHSNRVTGHSPSRRLRTQAAFLPVVTFAVRIAAENQEFKVRSRHEGTHLQSGIPKKGSLTDSEIVILSCDPCRLER